MKTIKKRKNIIKTVYKCEVCGAQSPWKSEIEICEKSHGCDHKNLQYEFTELEDVWLSHATGVECKCKDCGKQIGRYHFEEDIPEDKEQEILKGIYDILAAQVLQKKMGQEKGQNEG